MHIKFQIWDQFFLEGLAIIYVIPLVSYLFNQEKWLLNGCL